MRITPKPWGEMKAIVNIQSIIYKLKLVWNVPLLSFPYFFEKYKWKLFDFQIEKEPKYISKENFDKLMKNERVKQLQKNSEMKKLDEVN